MNPVFQAALDFYNAGISVVPARDDGSKAPIGSWKQYQVQRADITQLEEWFSSGHKGIGVICGQISGNLEMLELEGRAVAAGMLQQARELAINSGLEELWDLLAFGYVEVTPSGGMHFLYRISDEIVPGNTKIARRPGINDTVEVLAETRGTGGFVVTAPSNGTVHPTGGSWVMLNGSAATIPSISMEERNALHSIFKAFDEMPVKQSFGQLLAKDSSSDKPGDDFNAKTNWKDILEPQGWKALFTSGNVTYWRRPGKSTGISATTGRNDGDNLFVFSTSTTFEAERPYSKFAAFAHLHHHGDFSAAAKELRSRGFGSAPSLPSIGEITRSHLQVVPDLTSNLASSEPESIEQVRERSSWYLKGLDLSGDNDEPEPEFLARNDGSRLFYKGKINAILGESESGKSWLALHAVAQSLTQGKSVAYLDFEDSAKGILARLRALGLLDSQLAQFVYASPDENLTLEQRADLVDALIEYAPELIIVDGVNAAMTLLNLDLTSNRDATYFSQQLLKPLTMSGAGVITIDHVPKNKDNRGNYAIGAQAKRADINGSAIMVEVVMPFGRGMTGEVTLKVTKDRPGYVRAIAAEAKNAGRAVLVSRPDGQVRIDVQAPTLEGFRPTALMQKISEALEKEPMSKNSLRKMISAGSETIIEAANVLLKEGYIKAVNGSRNAIILHSVKPYRMIPAVSLEEEN